MEGTIGVITPWAANFAPLNWMFCAGQILSIAEYSPLYSLIGTTYGGNGTTTFALPNLCSRIPIGTGQGPGLTNRILGQPVGTSQNTLTTGQMAAHNHVLQIRSLMPVNANNATASTPQNNFPGTSSASIYNSTPSSGSKMPLAATVTVGVSGSSMPVENIQPVLCLNYVICVEGIWPSRP